MNIMRIYAVLILALAGSLFSGYLSAVKLFTHGCVLTVPCPFFLGQPACYFGFAMFAVLTVFAFLWAVGKRMRPWILSVAALGSLFAAYFTAVEWSAVVAFFAQPSLLSTPSCAVGLVVYILVLVLASLSEPQPTYK